MERRTPKPVTKTFTGDDIVRFTGILIEKGFAAQLTTFISLQSSESQDDAILLRLT
jgi:hypothetical protein